MAEILKSTIFGSSKKRMLSAPSAQANDKKEISHEEIDIVSPSRSSLSKKDLESLFAEEINEIKELAYSESFTNGYEDGKAAANEDVNLQKRKWEESIKEKELELDSKIQALDELLINIDAATVTTLRSLELASVSIAFAALTQLLGSSEGYRDRLAQQVDHAITQFGRDKPVRILLNKSDKELLSSLEKFESWNDRFIGQETIERGGCIIEAGPRSMDAGLTEQLGILRQLLSQLDEVEA